VPCECGICDGGPFVDEVAQLYVEDAVLDFRDQLRAVLRRENEGADEAVSLTAQALAAFRKQRGER
jgi:hypothetical protein